VLYCKASIATGLVTVLFARSDDLPLVKADNPNLDLDPDRSRFELGGGGGKLIGASLRLRIDIGEITVIALAGLETSFAKLEVVLIMSVRNCGGDRGPKV
jgi:hypothetical protein